MRHKLEFKFRLFAYSALDVWELHAIFKGVSVYGAEKSLIYQPFKWQRWAKNLNTLVYCVPSGTNYVSL